MAVSEIPRRVTKDSTRQSHIVIISEADCTALHQTWSNVVTEPKLSVVHGKIVNLNCKPGYTNIGANTAKCKYGKFVSTSGVPDCRGEFDFVNLGKG